jgi:hypothetical protein
VQLYQKLRRKKQLRVGLDDSTYLALRRAAKSAQTPKEEFVRDAIVKAVREVEYEQIRLAYLKQPDSEADAGDWESESDPA